MDKNKISQLQAAQLEIMSALHDICVKKNIKYYMIGGTLLGSVRHRGFIPWDIDIDIALLREDYEKLKLACDELLPPNMCYVDYTVDKELHSPHALVILRDSTVTRFDGKKFNVFVDVFPLDNVPPEERLQVKQAQDIIKMRKIKSVLMAIRAWREDNRFLYKFVKLILYPITQIYTIQHANERMQKIMQQYNGIKCENICSMASGYSYQKQNMPREIYGTPSLMPYEDHEFYGVEQYDRYLKKIYNNYLSIPNKADQDKIANYFVDVNICR